MIIDPEIYQKYPKEKVDEAITYLNYKKIDPLPKTELPGVPTLYVFRHGQTTDNEQMLFSGWRDPELTEKGVAQAEALADKLKDKQLHMLISSDFKRAIKTMAIAVSKNDYAKNLEIIEDQRIRERNYGSLQGTSKLLLHLDNPALAHDYRRSYAIAPPQGESLEMVIARVKNFIDDIVPKMKELKINVAVSCHGNSIRGFRQYFENLSNEQVAIIETPLAEDYAAYPIK